MPAPDWYFSHIRMLFQVSVAGDISAPGNDVEGCFEFADSFGEADISHYEDFPAVASGNPRLEPL
jgi:hypothetical protein